MKGKRLSLKEQSCDKCVSWAPAPAPQKGHCKALLKHTWGCQWCHNFSQEG